MNDTENLAKNLGINQDNHETVTEISEINTKEQLKAGEKLINKCKKIYQQGQENDLIWRWLIGKEVKNAYENTNIYEKGILKKISEELNIAISDLSRFHKFHLAFNKDLLTDRAKVGYTWSHFKLVNDVSDNQLKEKLINKIDKENDVPKVKELQSTINEERNSNDLNSDNHHNVIRPVNGALRTIDKLLNHLTDIHIQEKEGIDFNSDKQQEKYNTMMDEINDRMKQVIQFNKEIWS